MKSSNPIMVAILSVVAIGALGYVIVTFMNVGGAALIKAMNEPPAAKTVDLNELLPVELTKDPFMHPALVAAMLKGERMQKTGVQPGGAAAPSPIRGFLGELSTEPVSPPPPLPWAQGNPASSKNPAEPDENTEIVRQQPRKERPQITLTAIVEVEKPVAFLSLNGQESKAYRVGDQVAEDLRISAIEEGRVLFRTKRKSIELRIGEDLKL